MKLKRMIAMILCSCMTASLILGCSSGNMEKKKEKETVSTDGAGKYQEEDIPVPLKENEMSRGLCKSPKGSLMLYAQNMEEEKFYKYESKDGKEWKCEEASWLASVPKGIVGSIAIGQDGSEYAFVLEDITKDEKIPECVIHLLKKTDSGEAEEIDIPDLNKRKEFAHISTGLAVLENGNLALAGGEGVRVYDGAGGEQLYFLKQERINQDKTSYVYNYLYSFKPLSTNENKIAVMSKDCKGFVVYDGEEEETSMSYGEEVWLGKIILGKENDIYFLDKKGIHHMQPNGSLVETLADGSNMMMSSPSADIKYFVNGFQDDFYVLYGTEDRHAVIKRYFYDKQAKVGDEKKLTIYSLKENKNIQQAVSEFNQKHQNVEVLYQIGESGGITTREDQIRVLNTELLNKNGPDVLILDDLPIESFLEKGILKDMSGILNPMIEDGTLQKNIAKCYRDEAGKIYRIPARYGVPILYGNQDRMDAMQTMDSLEIWLDEHPDIPFMESKSTTYEVFTKLLINMYYEELFGADGKLKKEKVKQCLSIVKKAQEQIKGEMESYFAEQRAGEELKELEPLSWWNAGSSVAVAKEGSIAADEIGMRVMWQFAYSAMRECNMVPAWNRDIFVPHIIAGINSGAKEPELAEEFIKELLSEKVQLYDFEDGLPVNTKAAQKWIAKGLDQPLITGEEALMTSQMPLKTELQYLFEGAKTLRKPAETDNVLLDMIFEEAKLYYEGSKNLEEAVQGITSKVDTYHAE